MIQRITSFTYTPRASEALHADLAQLRLRHREALCGEDVAHLRGADAEGDGADGAVGGGVAVAARDGHARLGEAELGADDVDDALLARRHVEELQVEVLHVAIHVLRHLLRLRVGVGTGLVRGRDDVVERAERALRHSHLELQLLQHLEGLRRRHLVDEMQADQKLGLAGRERATVCASHTLSSSVRAIGTPLPYIYVRRATAHCSPSEETRGVVGCSRQAHAPLAGGLGWVSAME